MICSQASVGGFSLGLERTNGFETVAFCEIDPYCRAVLKKHWPDVPCYDDVRTLTADRLAADGIAVDVICGGFPCQDISSSGNKVGLSGARSGLWREFHRLIREIRPQFAILENVSDLLNRGLGEVLGDLAEIRFDADWDCVGAADVGLPQGRDRIWIVVYPNGGGLAVCEERHGTRARCQLRLDDDGLALAQRRARQALSHVRRVDDGLPNGLDRLVAAGNSVTPENTQIIGNAILSAIASDRVNEPATAPSSAVA